MAYAQHPPTYIYPCLYGYIEVTMRRPYIKACPFAPLSAGRMESLSIYTPLYLTMTIYIPLSINTHVKKRERKFFLYIPPYRIFDFVLKWSPITIYVSPILVYQRKNMKQFKYNKKQKATIDAHNKKVIQQIIVDEHNKRAIEFFNSQKVEISTKSQRWNR